MIFHSSFNEGIFLEQLKVAKVSPIFKVCNIEEVGNYTEISALDFILQSIRDNNV